MREEQELLARLSGLQDPQCAWLLLAMCASLRANHALPAIAPYDAVSDTLDALTPQKDSEFASFCRVAVSTQGPGLLPAERAVAGFWAAWEDALPVLRQRSPALAEPCVHLLASGGGCAPCSRSAAEALCFKKRIGPLARNGWMLCRRNPSSMPAGHKLG